MTGKTVRYRDPKTDTIINIPETELAPGVVQVHQVGETEPYWIDSHYMAEQAGKMPVRHPVLPEELLARIHSMRELIQFIFPDKTTEEWEEGFRHDTHPEREVAIWEKMLWVFCHFAEGRRPDPEQRRDLFDVILCCVNNGPEQVHHVTRPRTLSRKRVQEIVDFMFPKEDEK